MHIHISMCTQIQIHKYKYTNTSTKNTSTKNTFSPRHLIIYHSLAAPQLRNVITGRRAGNFFGGGRFAKGKFLQQDICTRNFFRGRFAKEMENKLKDPFPLIFPSKSDQPFSTPLMDDSGLLNEESN